MKDFKSGGFRGGDHRDRGSNHGGDAFRAGGRPNFAKKPWDKGGKNFGGDKQMFRAVCGSCGKPCEVPFRPVDGRPVFCADCFMSNKPNDSRGDFKRDFKPSYNQGSVGGETYRAPKPDPRIDAVVKQLESLHAKLDLLISNKGVKTKSEAKLETVADIIAAATESDKKPFKMAKKVKTTKKVSKKK